MKPIKSTLILLLVGVSLSACSNSEDTEIKFDNTKAFCTEDEFIESIEDVLDEPVEIISSDNECNEMKYYVHLSNRENDVNLVVSNFSELDKDTGDYTNTFRMNYCLDIIQSYREERQQISVDMGIYSDYDAYDVYTTSIKDTSEFRKLAEYYYKIQELYQFNCPRNNNYGSLYKEYIIITNEEVNNFSKEEDGESAYYFLMETKPFSINKKDRKTINQIEKELNEQYEYYKTFKSIQV